MLFAVKFELTLSVTTGAVKLHAGRFINFRVNDDVGL
jgi:hypothetical protein